MRRRTVWIAWMAAAVTGLTTAQAASGATFCVQAPACVADGGTAVGSFGAAITAANGSPVRDRIVVGPVTQSGGPFTVTDVDIEGAGTDTTVLDTGIAHDGQPLLTLTNGTVADLTVRVDLGSNVSGLQLQSSRADRVTVDLSQATYGGGVRPQAVVMESGPDEASRAIFARGRIVSSVGGAVAAPSGMPTPVVVEDSELLDVVPAAPLIDASAEVTIARSRLSAPGAVLGGSGGTFAVTSSILRGQTILAGGDAEIDRSTLVGVGGSATGVNVQINSTVTVTSSAFTGFATDARRQGLSPCLPLPGGGCASIDYPAHLTIRNSLVDPGKVESSGPGTFVMENNVTGDPGFRSAIDLRPRFDSVLVDAGAGSSTAPDIEGVTQKDGDGDGVVVPDIGAHEYLRAAPVVTVTAPETGSTAAPVSLSATATDPDDETLGDITWTFDDGTTASGATVSKTFAAGTRTATASVTDAAGLTGTATATIVVEQAPVPVPPPPTPIPAQTPLGVSGGTGESAPEAPGTTVKPVFASVRGGRIRVDTARRVRLRVSCPKAAARACAGRLELRSSKRLRIGRRAKAKYIAFGRASYKVQPGKARTYTLRLSRSHAALVRSRRKISSRATVRGANSAGRTTSQTRAVTLLPPVKKTTKRR
jgi:hypothetical protein